MTQRLLVLAAALLTGCALRAPIRTDLPDGPIAEIPRELRGLWVASSDWAHADADTMRQRIDAVMSRAGETRFNAVFFQVRGQAETLYPSPLEPWSGLVGFRDPGFDPQFYAIDSAHRHGLQFHACVSLLPLWDQEEPPDAPDHLYHRRGPAVPADSSWVCFGDDGQPMALNEYVYLNPAHPEVKAYLKGVIRHLVESYDLEGLHFDRFRYPGPAYLGDPYSRAQFTADSAATGVSPGNCGSSCRSDWARARLTDLVEDVVAEALLVKPYLLISAATWGLYRTDDMDRYGEFGSGYSEYYQDAIDWLDRGIVDFIVPMIYWDIGDPRPNFHELWADFQRRTPNWEFIFPGLRVGSEWLVSGETVSQIRYVRRTGGLGHVMWDTRAASSDAPADIVSRIFYPNPVEVPAHLKRTRAEQVVGLDLSSVAPASAAGQSLAVPAHGRPKTLDAGRRANLILPALPDTLRLRTGDISLALPTQRWCTPYRYQAHADSTVSRASPWVELRNGPSDTTTASHYHFLFRTEHPAVARVNGDTAQVYRTGVFFDSLGLAEGVNRVRAEVVYADSSRALYERQYVGVPDEPRPPFPLWLDEGSVEPRRDLVLLPEDVVRVTFRASLGQQASIRLRPGKLRIPCDRQDHDEYSEYRADVPLRLLRPGRPHRVEIILESSTEARVRDSHEHELASTITVQHADQFPLVRTTRDECYLSYSQGRVRLGGPYIAEYGPGVVLQTSGRIGNAYRVRLDPQRVGYIPARQVEELPAGAVRPTYHIYSLQAAPSDSGDADLVRLPWPEPVPYAVSPDPDGQRLLVTLYGVAASSTWVQHRSGTRYVDKLTWEQIAPETYQVAVHLHDSRIWGYEIQPEGSSLVLRLPYPPVLGATGTPFAGLRIAIEAGHGGTNTGAVGLSGLLEKDVNLDTALRLGELCRAAGMEVYQLRPGDEGVPYMARRDSAVTWGAHLLVSIHANAGGSSRGYLRIGGTSTYYHDPFWAPFAGRVYDRLLELGLEEFGVVGSFNYRITRTSSIPAILVEQAFMSHAEDEEKLADPAFRQRLAEQIFAGLADYLEYMLRE